MIESVNLWRYSWGAILLKNAHEVLLLFMRLETAVTELGGGVDESQVDVFSRNPLRLSNERFSDVKNSLPDTDAGSL